MIEFFAEADIYTVESILVEVGNQGNFSIAPDRFKKSTGKHKKYALFYSKDDLDERAECGSIELILKKENKILVKVNTGIMSLDNDLNDTVSTVDRFFYLLTQRMLQEKVVDFGKEDVLTEIK